MPWHGTPMKGSPRQMKNWDLCETLPQGSPENMKWPFPSCSKQHSLVTLLRVAVCCCSWVELRIALAMSSWCSLLQSKCQLRSLGIIIVTWRRVPSSELHLNIHSGVHIHREFDSPSSSGHDLKFLSLWWLMASNSAQVQHVAAAGFAFKVVSRGISSSLTQQQHEYLGSTDLIASKITQQAKPLTTINLSEVQKLWPMDILESLKTQALASMTVSNSLKSQVLVWGAIAVALKTAICNHGFLPAETGPEIRQLGFSCSTSTIRHFQ